MKKVAFVLSSLALAGFSPLVMAQQEAGSSNQATTTTTRSQTATVEDQAATGDPLYLNQVKKSVESQSGEHQRVPAQATPTQAAPAQPAQKTEAESQPKNPVGTQISFVELSPTLGSISIASQSNLSLGTNVSFRISPDFPAYFEPGVLLSFFNGGNNRSTTIWHIDAGLRYDFAIGNSALVPFLKAAIGPSLAATSGITSSNGDVIPDSYLNAFLGGGFKILASSRIAARIDAGTTLQNSSFGLYVLGSAVLPL